MTLICRTGFCPSCNGRGNPKEDQLFLVHGNGGYHVHKSKGFGRSGFTPHLYRLLKATNDTVHYESVCGMNGCKVSIWKESGKHHFMLPLTSWQKGTMSLKDWNALVQYKHDKDYEI